MVYFLLVKENHMSVSIVAMEVQIRMTLDVVGEEVVGLREVGMVMNVSNEIKATLEFTNMVNLLAITMNVLSKKSKRQI